MITLAPSKICSSNFEGAFFCSPERSNVHVFVSTMFAWNFPGSTKTHLENLSRAFYQLPPILLMFQVLNFLSWEKYTIMGVKEKLEFLPPSADSTDTMPLSDMVLLSARCICKQNKISIQGHLRNISHQFQNTSFLQMLYHLSCINTAIFTKLNPFQSQKMKQILKETVNMNMFCAWQRWDIIKN